MPPKVQQKSKEAKALAASSGGKGKKKKAKGRTKDKTANKVLFDKETHERLLVEAPKMKLITVSALVERLKINGSLARASIKLLMAKGLIRQVSHSSSQIIYTRATNTGAD